MITPVWGTEYIERWLDLCFASQRAEGNIPFLIEHCQFELVIATKVADVDYMQNSQRFRTIMAGIPVRFVTIDEFFPPQGSIPYGVPLTLAYAKAINELGEQAIGTFVMIMNADCLVAAGAYKSLLDRIQAGYTIICTTSIRSVDGCTLDQLNQRIDPDTGIISISSRSMMKLALTNLHSSVSGRVLNDLNDIDSTYYHQMFWRVSDDCLAMRAFMVHPLCFQIERCMEKVICPVDYGFMIELSPNGKFCVLEDSDLFAMMELQSRDSEAHWLRITPNNQNQSEHFAQVGEEIVAHAATWTTSEHRRFVEQTILFHSGDLPDNLEDHLAPFNAFVDQIVERLPPPVSHIGHFQWLPAVRIYGEEMTQAGATEITSLLDDPRNLETLPPPKRTQPCSKTNPLPSETPTRFLSPFYALGFRLVCSLKYRMKMVVIRKWCRQRVKEALHKRGISEQVRDVVVVGDVNKDTPSFNPAVRIHRYKNPSQSNFHIHPPSRARVSGGQLVIYARVGLLQIWKYLGEDIEALLASHSHVAIVLIEERFQRLSVLGNTYMLSILLSDLFRPYYDTHVDVVTAPLIEEFGEKHSDGKGTSPSYFSALIITLCNRNKP